MKKLLALRKEISKRRPEFVQQDQHKRPDLQLRWRKPKGMHSKMRHGVWGRPASVNIGYRGPAAVRGLDNSGLIPMLVYNLQELGTVDAKTHGVIIGSVGGKKKTELLTACKQKNITVLNIKKVDETIKMLTDRVTDRKAAKKEAAKRREARTKAAPKKENKKEEVTKEQEKKEMDKVLTQKEA